VEDVASEGEAMVADLGRSREDSEYSMGLTGKWRTKMVTCRLSKEFVQEFIQTHPPIWPFTHSTSNHIQRLLAHHISEYEVKCELHAYWQCQCVTSRGMLSTRGGHRRRRCMMTMWWSRTCSCLLNLQEWRKRRWLAWLPSSLIIILVVFKFWKYY